MLCALGLTHVELWSCKKCMKQQLATGKVVRSGGILRNSAWDCTKICGSANAHTKISRDQCLGIPHAPSHAHVNCTYFYGRIDGLARAKKHAHVYAQVWHAWTDMRMYGYMYMYTSRVVRTSMRVCPNRIISETKRIHTNVGYAREKRIVVSRIPESFAFAIYHFHHHTINRTKLVVATISLWSGIVSGTNSKGHSKCMQCTSLFVKGWAVCSKATQAHPRLMTTHQWHIQRLQQIMWIQNSWSHRHRQNLWWSRPQPLSERAHNIFQGIQKWTYHSCQWPEWCHNMF